ncbi:hypothetical protein [Caenimonas koreensis]|uniref:hypothetical protein n=1 Tax=Caenimonas koreensis TaxID=367474 RepID=UPI0037849FE7
MSATLIPTVIVNGPEPARRSWAAGTIYLGIALAVVFAWLLVRSTGLRAGSDAGYWIGVAGGVLMVLLFAYPLRKRVRFMARLGAAKWWFAVHMVLGIGGPLLILVHSTFRVGSLNAGVALYSMLVVGASGVVGRFLYLHVHRGLNGERQSMSHLQHALGLRHDSVHAALSDTRNVEGELLDFERYALAGPPGMARHLRAFTLVPLRRRWLEAHCASELKAAIRERARRQSTSHAAARHEYRSQKRAMQDYLQVVQRVAQFQGAVRLFSLWHVLHVPFVYVMVASAIVHVVAVHAY